MSTTATPTAPYEAVEQIVEIPLDHIRSAPDNPRGDLGDLTDLANSIKSAGVVQPITVTPRPEEGQPPYMVVMGDRRQAASKLAGKTTIPGIIRDYDETTRKIVMHIENVQRVDLKPTEEARSLQALVDLGLSQRQIVEKVGKSQAYISKRLSLLGLPREIQAEVDAGRLLVGDAIELARLKDDRQIQRIFSASRRTDNAQVTYEGVTMRVTKALADAARERKVAQVQRSLRAEGVNVVDYTEVARMGSDSPRKLDSILWQVTIDPDKHARMKCHGVTVTPDAEVVYVCVEPARHKAKSPRDGEPAPAARRIADDEDASPEAIAAERERAEEEAWREYHQREAARVHVELVDAAERRRTFIGDFIRGRFNKNEVLTLILTDYVHAYDYRWGSSEVLASLGITVEDGRDPDDAFQEYAGQSLANLTRAALAVRLDELEGEMPQAMGDFNAVEVRQQYAFLIGNGYEPAEIEARGLAEAAARDAERAAAEAAAESDDDDATADVDDAVSDQADGTAVDSTDPEASEPVVDAVAEGDAA
jgi:ParB/RepB/Spo0J family partition protein